MAVASSKGGEKEISVPIFFPPLQSTASAVRKYKINGRSKCHKNLFIKGDGRVESGCGGSGQINYSQSQS